MKLINQPIKVAVIFTETGEVKPFAFIYNNKKYGVVKILKEDSDYSYKTGETKRYRLQIRAKHDDDRICEIKFIKSENIWVLYIF